MCSTCWVSAGDLGNGLFDALGRIFDLGHGEVQIATADYGTKFVVVAGLLNFISAVDAHNSAHWQEGLMLAPSHFFRRFALRHLCFCSVRYHAAVHAESHGSVRSLRLEHLRRRRDRGQLGDVADQEIAEKQSTEFSRIVADGNAARSDRLLRLLKDVDISSLLPPGTPENGLPSLLSHQG